MVDFKFPEKNRKGTAIWLDVWFSWMSQWRIQNFLRVGCQSQGGDASLFFAPPQKKLHGIEKKIGLRGGADALKPPFWFANYIHMVYLITNVMSFAVNKIYNSIFKLCNIMLGNQFLKNSIVVNIIYRFKQFAMVMVHLPLTKTSI